MSNKTVALCLVMLALGSAAGAAAMRFFVMPSAPAPRCEPVAAPRAPPCPEVQAAAPAPTPLAQPPAAAPDAPEPAPIAAKRVVVCENATGTPLLRALGPATVGSAWAVHCGSQAQIVAVQGSGESAVLHRIASIATRTPNPELSADAAPVLAADLNADGKPDLLVPFLYRDADASPRGGALYELLRDDSGSFGRPQPLAASAVRALALTHVTHDAENKNPDLFIVHAEDARVSRPSELVVMHGGPSPVRAFVAPLGLAARSVAAVDIDLDSHDDAIVAGQKPEVEVLYLDGKGGVRERTTFELTNAREALAADIDGDGHDDAVLAGDALAVMIASSEARELREIAGSERMIDVAAIDVNADGRLDLVGYAAPALVAFVQLPAGSFERRVLCTFATLPFAPLAIAIAGAPTADIVPIVAIGRDRSQARRIELSTIACARGVTPRFGDEVGALADAPLKLDLHVP